VSVDDPHTGAINFTPVAVFALESTDEAEPETHEERTDEEHRTTSPSVDIDDGGDGEYDVEDVLDGVGDKVTTATCETCTFEDIYNVVHHNIHSAKLRPHLERTTETNAAENTRLEEIQVRLGAFSTFKVDLMFDLLVFENNKIVALVTSTVKIGENF